MLSNLADSFARQDRIEEVRRTYNTKNHTTYLARTAIRTHGRTGCGRLRLASATLTSRDLVSTTLCCRDAASGISLGIVGDRRPTLTVSAQSTTRARSFIEYTLSLGDISQRGFCRRRKEDGQ